MPTVSVAICAFNAAPYVHSALASVAAQSRPPDEVVFVDDGSSDGTAAIAEDWCGRLPLKVIRSSSNGGVGSARRSAIEASTGDLVVLLDADDYWFPDHLEVLCGAYERHGGIVTAVNYRWVAGAKTGTRPSTSLIPVPPPERQAVAILEANFVFSGSLFSRDLYDRVGGVRDDVSSEDWDLWIRMIQSGARVTAAPTVTMLYRQHPAAVSSGESLTRGDVALLEQVAATSAGTARRRAKRALRRQQARVLMLDGYDQIRAGRIAAGRRTMALAVITDRNLRRATSYWGGCVTLRAAACVVAPRKALAVRDARRTDPDIRVGTGRDRPWLGALPRSRAST
ncbi:MAG TPA: glycosyltransferase family 2 protein [Acidimicrobiales bacterium]|nr:glycosyltransferase family 2 protein [Acidimicrobiales bacterium]